MSERVLGGRYTVQDKIGTGGMAIVYRGLDNVLGRTVAIKTMLPQYAADPSFAARFKQEAQAAAALQSPYIVSVYDWGKDGDTYYIAMEYLRGTDLKSGIRKHGALDGKKVAQIGSQIAQALSVAHRHDIIHRDIKPQNIMVQPDGNIKVMDFGIARAKNSHLTTDNSVLGTAHYVSPEQTQGKELGPTTDIYSLGIVMYEAATGSVPFDGDDAISVALKQVNEQPMPPSQRNPAVNAPLEAIILKCMQKDPSDRFQSADELYHVLRDYLAGRVAAVNNATAMLPVAATTPVATPIPATTGSTAQMAAVEPLSRVKTQTATERAQAQVEERERKHRRHVVIGAIVGAIALVGIIVGLFSIFGSNNQTRPVPNLLNLTEEQALSTIAADDFFQKGTVKSQYSSTVAKGLVIDQTPDQGTNASRGTQIDIVVSKGEEPAAPVTVPDLKGMTPSRRRWASRARRATPSMPRGSTWEPSRPRAPRPTARPRPGTPSPTSFPKVPSRSRSQASSVTGRTAPPARLRPQALASPRSTRRAIASTRATSSASHPHRAPPTRDPPSPSRCPRAPPPSTRPSTLAQARALPQVPSRTRASRSRSSTSPVAATLLVPS